MSATPGYARYKLPDVDKEEKGNAVACFRIYVQLHVLFWYTCNLHLCFPF